MVAVIAVVLVRAVGVAMVVKDSNMKFLIVMLVVGTLISLENIMAKTRQTMLGAVLVGDTLLVSLVVDMIEGLKKQQSSWPERGSSGQGRGV